MRVLIIGGRNFLGRHIVDSCLKADHQVTLFNRGITNAELYSDLDFIKGSRESDLNKLAKRKWDVVFDTCGYWPENVKSTAQALSSSVKHYIYISSCSVYDLNPKVQTLDETAEICQVNVDKNNLEPFGKDYGICKYLCEKEIDNNFSGMITHIRPGLIVGPYDPTGRFPYWIQRLSKGGLTLAPPLSSPTSFIDARDLSDWCVYIAKNKIQGTFNACGPLGSPITIGDFLSLANTVLGNKSELVSADENFLKQNDIQCWTELPMWVYKEIEFFLLFNSKKAISNGLKFRPIEETVFDTAKWMEDKGMCLNSLKHSTLKPEKEEQLLLKLQEPST